MNIKVEVWWEKFTEVFENHPEEKIKFDDFFSLCKPVLFFDESQTLATR